MNFMWEYAITQSLLYELRSRLECFAVMRSFWACTLQVFSWDTLRHALQKTCLRAAVLRSIFQPHANSAKVAEVT